LNDILHDFQGAAHLTPKVASTWTTDSASYNTSGESGATALLVSTLTKRENTYELIVVCRKKRIVILLQTAYNTPTSIDNIQAAFKHTLSFIYFCELHKYRCRRSTRTHTQPNGNIGVSGTSTFLECGT